MGGGGVGGWYERESGERRGEMVHCCRGLRVEGWPPELAGDGEGMKHDF